MRNLILGVACILSVSMSVTMSAQADINDFINAQVSGTSIYMEYSHQMMLDSIDVMLDSIDAQNVLLGSVTAPEIISGATGNDLEENSGVSQPIYTITATATWLAPTYAIAGTDAALLGVDASTGVVTLTADPVYATKSSYSFTVTATDAAGNESNATTVTFAISAAGPPAAAFVDCGDPYTFDGYSYATVLIGTQCWFAENLRTTEYADGTLIPGGLDNATWGSMTSGALTIYEEGGANEAANLADYGRLYNWHAVNAANGLCPSGWHVPNDDEYTTLTDGLGGRPVAGGKMKSSASDSPAWDGTNESGFLGLPGGYRANNGAFGTGGASGLFWSASTAAAEANVNILNGFNDELVTNDLSLNFGFSVRCVLD